MVAVGVVLVLVGAALLVAEAHLPAGVLGVGGALALAAGAALAIAGAGGGLALILTGAPSAGPIAALWVGVGARQALAAGLRPTVSRREGRRGPTGVVRRSEGTHG